MKLFVSLRDNRRRIWALACFGLLSISVALATTISRHSVGPCYPTQFAQIKYVVCEIDLHVYELRTFLLAADGKPFGSFDRLRQATEDSTLAVAMNAGMFQETLLPVGLYIENGKTESAPDLSNGTGNFYLKPNGVFFVRGRSAGILEMNKFLEENLSVDFATQSGPMLVIDGQIHPKIAPDGVSRKIRNGIGVINEHTVILAISNEPVSFGKFAKLFRNKFRCSNALYFDGAISSLYAPSVRRSDSRSELGPIIAAIRRKDDFTPPP
jgi:uncharacterized protein YigE (DUF2233 family)